MKTEVTEAFEFLAAHSGCLSNGQIELLKSLQKYYRENKALTEQQMKTLLEIRKYST